MLAMHPRWSEKLRTSAPDSNLPVSLSKDAQMTCEQQSTDVLMKLKRLSS